MGQAYWRSMGSRLESDSEPHVKGLTDRRRRRSVAGVTEAVVGFQHGRCLICGDLLGDVDPIAVDHVFPYSLMDRSTLLGWPDMDLDGIWNLAPAHGVCNAVKSNRPPKPVEKQRPSERNAAIMLSPHPLRKTLELVLRSRDFAGQPNDWVPFLAHLM